MYQKLSRADSNGDQKDGSKNEKTPSEEGASSFLVTGFPQVSVGVSSGGGGNCTRVPESPSLPDRQELIRMDHWSELDDVLKSAPEAVQLRFFGSPANGG